MTSTIKVNNIQNQCGANIINENSNTITIGASGDTISLASGASQSGFGREGSVDWQTGSIKTSTFTAVSGEGYFINSSSEITANLPAGSAGAIVAFSDYARNFNTYNLIVTPNGSEKIGGIADPARLNVNGQSATFVYVDSTKGWVNVQNAEDTETGVPNAYITATGGTITTVCTNFKVHTFTGPGTFCISAGSGSLAKVDYLVIAGGGGGSQNYGGGGGAGGYRESKTAPVSGCWTASPLAAAASLGPFSPGPIAVTVGGGGTAPTCAPSPGSDSVFSTITSTGGGRAGGNAPGNSPCGTSYFQGLPGGSGGGSRCNNPGGTGNDPSVSPPQGNDGGDGAPPSYASGGGGATTAGGDGGSGGGGNGGNGATSSITASPVTRAGGGAGKGNAPSGTAGPGGGGASSGPTSNKAGTANTGGGGGAGCSPIPQGGAGGSGVVIVRYRFQA